MEKSKKAAAMKGTPDTSRERQDDQSAEPSSEDFWLSLQANSKIQASMSSILTPRLKELFLKCDNEVIDLGTVFTKIKFC